MKPIQRLALIAALLTGLSLTTACSPKTPRLLDWSQDEVSESRWSATYTAGGESTPLTLILMTAENPGPARLVALSAFGATLGDCVVTNGRGQCRGPREAEGLMTRISGAIGVMLERDAAFLTDPGKSQAQIGALGWQAARDAAGVVEYRLTTASSWTLVMKKTAAK